jgi:hypothetical protein
MNLFDENSHLNEEGVALYVDALNLNTFEQLPEPVLEHVSECDTCKLNIEELFQLLEEEVEKPEEQRSFFRSRPKLESLNRSIFYRIAAVLLVGIGLYGIIRLGLPGRDQGKIEGSTQIIPPSSAGIDSSSKGTAKNLLSDNYAVSPELEGMIGVHYRSSDIEVESPTVGERIHGKVAFKWAWGEKEKVILKIVNNKGKEVVFAQTNENGYEFSGTLDRGLYYWRLETANELLYVGKFIVE